MNTTTHEEFVKEYSELVRLHHPELSKRNRDALVERMVDITERFVAALAAAPADSVLSSPGYDTFRGELKSLPKWFQDHLRRR